MCWALLLHLFNQGEICLCRPFRKHIWVLALVMSLFCWFYFCLLRTVVLLPGLFVKCFGLVSLWVCALWFIFKVFYLVAVSLWIAVAVRTCRVKAWGFAPEHKHALATDHPADENVRCTLLAIVWRRLCLRMMNAVHVIMSFQPGEESWLIHSQVQSAAISALPSITSVISHLIYLRFLFALPAPGRCKEWSVRHFSFT